MASILMVVASLHLQLGKGSFSSSSQKQKLTTKSSTEAEIVCAANSVGNLLGFRNYLLWCKVRKENEAS
jgi:hypothetical protein